MKKLILILLFIQGVMMGAVLESIEVKGVKIPLIYEKESNLPIVSMQIVFQKSGSIEDGDLAGLAKFSAKNAKSRNKKFKKCGFCKKVGRKSYTFWRKYWN